MRLRVGRGTRRGGAGGGAELEGRGEDRWELGEGFSGQRLSAPRDSHNGEEAEARGLGLGGSWGARRVRLWPGRHRQMSHKSPGRDRRTRPRRPAWGAAHAFRQHPQGCRWKSLRGRAQASR